MTVDQALQRCSQLLAQTLGLKELPLVELRAIRQRKPTQEVAAIQRHRLAEERLAVGTDCLCGMRVLLAFRQPLPELMDIDPQLRALRQADALALGQQP